MVAKFLNRNEKYRFYPARAIINLHAFSVGKGWSFKRAPRMLRDHFIYIVTKKQARSDSSIDINARTNVLSRRKCHCCVVRNVLATNEKLPQNTPQEPIEFKNIYYLRLKCLATGKKSRENYRKSPKIASRKIMDNRKNHRKSQPLGRLFFCSA